MKKNRINTKITTPLLALIFTLASCSGFLGEDPKGKLTNVGFYKTIGHAEGNVNTLYRVGAPTFDTDRGAYYGTHGMLGGYLTGYFDSEYAGQEMEVTYSKNLNRDAVNVADKIDEIWGAAYKAIAIANDLITKMPDIEMPDSIRTGLIGTAKFFRAYNYFYLVKMFGDVPLILEAYNSLEGLSAERKPTKDVYNQIVVDLKEAVVSLPNDAFYENKCCITSNVANTLLAEVYLQMSGFPLNENHYADAADAAKKVIESGKHSLTPNDDFAAGSAYNKMRTTERLAEVIYAYEYKVGIQSAGYRPVWALPNSAAGWADMKYAITNNIYGVVIDNNQNGYTNIYNPTEDLRIQPNQFFHWKFTKPDGVVEDLKGTCNWWFYDEDAVWNSGGSSHDAVIFRYPEVLLIAAEALAQTGDKTAAAGYLAKVKARSSITGKTEAQFEAELVGLSSEDLTKEVWAERLREFPLEFKIWDDILRTRQFPIFEKSNEGKVKFVDVVGAKNALGNTLKESDLLWPLSTNELQRNPSLTQNPGY